jgi:hypothetical protein
VFINAAELQQNYLAQEGADNPIFQELQAGGDLAIASLATGDSEVWQIGVTRMWQAVEQLGISPYAQYCMVDDNIADARAGLFRAGQPIFSPWIALSH